MFEIGSLELVLCLIAFVLFVLVPYCLSRYLGQHYPDNLLLACALAFMFGPWGQVYVEENAGAWATGIIVATVALKMFLENVDWCGWDAAGTSAALLLSSLLSAAVMKFRLREN